MRLFPLPLWDLALGSLLYRQRDSNPCIDPDRTWLRGHYTVAVRRGETA